jgi:gliding motility-associated-like protein
MLIFLYSKRSLTTISAFVLLQLLLPSVLSAQVAGFVSPDTVYVDEPVAITNTSTGGSTWYWSFCSGDANNLTIQNIGNPGNQLVIPTYLTLVNQGTDCFSFVSCQGIGVIRYFHGLSFKNDPESSTNLGTFGEITFNQEGIQVKEDNGQWFGFVCSDTKLVRLNFGTTLWNTPTAISLPSSGLNMLHGLVIIKEGATWLGFATCSTGNTMVRFNFGSSLSNIPVMTDFGNLAGFNSPGAICLVKENSSWYGLIVAGGNSLARITFGNSLLNTPTGVNLGNPGGFNNAVGLTLIHDCESTVGYWTNYQSPGLLGKLVFPNGIAGNVTGEVLGNVGNLDKPHSFSEIFRQNDTLYAYITNRQSGTLTKLIFPPCKDASLPSTALFTPPQYSYVNQGTFNIMLVMDEGLPTESVICKNIVVLARPVIITAKFSSPDTVCAGTTFQITNQSTAGTACYWSFCSDNTLADPVGINIGNPGNLLNIPAYVTLVKDGSTCYSFVPGQGNASLTRYNHGPSFNNNPVSWSNLGDFGMLGDTVMGIKICYDKGQWIGFLNNNNRIVRLNFGTSPGNSPTATLLGPYSMLYSAHCIDIFEESGLWVGYVTCSLGNKLVRLSFGNSLLNTPTLTDLGTPGSLNMPAGFCFIDENGIWYALVVNLGNNTLSRLTFGNSLLNNPVGVNLGSACPSINPGGIALVRSCEGTVGFQLNYSTSSPDLIWRLSFPSGITGPVTGASLGNIGTMSRPAQFSELFRVGDTLFLYATNRQDFTLTRLRFFPCLDALVPSSVLYDPPPCSFNQPGTYNVRLIVNEGMPSQASLCKQIVVTGKPSPGYVDTTLCYGTPWYAGGAMQTQPGIYHDTIPKGNRCDSILQTTLRYKPEIKVSLGKDTVFCNGVPVTLQTGVSDAGYEWQDGSTDSIFYVPAPGNYWVTVNKEGCSASDSIHIGECVSPLWFPNVFTPNGDGLNDTFHPVGNGVARYNIFIYDRWGKEIYASAAVEPGWDGRLNGEICSDGVYMFIATYVINESSGETYYANGSVTLLR